MTRIPPILQFSRERYYMLCLAKHILGLWQEMFGMSSEIFEMVHVGYGGTWKSWPIQDKDLAPVTEKKLAGLQANFSTLPGGIQCFLLSHIWVVMTKYCNLTASRCRWVYLMVRGGEVRKLICTIWCSSLYYALWQWHQRW